MQVLAVHAGTQESCPRNLTTEMHTPQAEQKHVHVSCAALVATQPHPLRKQPCVSNARTCSATPLSSGCPARSRNQHPQCLTCSAIFFYWVPHPCSSSRQLHSARAPIVVPASRPALPAAPSFMQYCASAKHEPAKKTAAAQQTTTAPAAPSVTECPCRQRRVGEQTGLVRLQAC